MRHSSCAPCRAVGASTSSSPSASSPRSRGRLTAPRALALIGQLKANDDYFAKHYAPAPKTDITDADGLVYRYFAGRCLEFHPLANFGALNARVAANDADGAQQLADALIARGVYQQGGGIAWEYYFDFSRRPRAVALGHGAGGRRTGVRTDGGARHRARHGADERGARRVSRHPRAPADERRRRAVDPPLFASARCAC